VKQLLIHLPEHLKAKLDAKRTEGYTASGLIRALLEREFKKPVTKCSQKGGMTYGAKGKKRSGTL
jgi:hypothetical protein